MKPSMALPPALQSILQLVVRQASGAGQPVWLAGGCLRDLLLDRPVHDLDLVLPGAVSHARRLADQTGGAFVLLDEQHQVARTLLQHEGVTVVLDWSDLRAESLERDLYLRDLTVNAMAIPLAALLGQPQLPVDALVDPLDGLSHLRQRLLYPTSQHAIIDDPLRALRAVRLAAELSFGISEQLHQLLLRDGLLVTGVAAERVREELLRLLQTPQSAVFLRYLDELRILTALLPELELTRGVTQPIVHFLDVLEHLLEAVCAADWLLNHIDGRPSQQAPIPPAVQPGFYPPAFFAVPEAVRRLPELSLTLPYAEQLRSHFGQELGAGHQRRGLWKLAVLLHDIAKPQTKQPKPGGGVSFHGHQSLGAEQVAGIAERLRFSRAEVSYLCTVVREHMRPGQLADIEDLSPRAVFRFFRDTGAAGIDVLLHSHVDHMATAGPSMRLATWDAHLRWTSSMLHALYAQHEVVRPRRLVDGKQLMQALGLSPGPEVGRLLNLLQEAQAAGEVRSVEEALAFARAQQRQPQPE